MTTSDKIRVGIVGASPDRGFASVAHIPALRGLPDFAIAAVCTTRQESVDATARHFGIPLAFSDPVALARHPEIDLVTVSVKVPDHLPPVMAAIEAGKHVYCEWPLGRDTDEAVRMLDAAEGRGIRHAVGLQGQMSPAINYVKDLIADGYVGRVLTATQRQELTVRGAQGAAKELAELPVPARYRWVPTGMPGDSRYNVAQLYARSAERIRDGKPANPGFAAAVTRHRLLDAIVRASETGRKQAA